MRATRVNVELERPMSVRGVGVTGRVYGEIVARATA